MPNKPSAFCPLPTPAQRAGRNARTCQRSTSRSKKKPPLQASVSVSCVCVKKHQKRQVITFRHKGELVCSVCKGSDPCRPRFLSPSNFINDEWQISGHTPQAKGRNPDDRDHNQNAKVHSRPEVDNHWCPCCMHWLAPLLLLLLLCCCCVVARLLLCRCCAAAVLLWCPCCPAAVLLLCCCCPAAAVLLLCCCPVVPLLYLFFNIYVS